MDTSLFLVIWGGTLVLILGAVGTYAWLRTAVTPQERGVVVTQVRFCWVVASVLAVGILAIPRPFGFLLWLPCGIITPVMINRWNRRLEEIRNEERRTREELFLRGTPETGREQEK